MYNGKKLYGKAFSNEELNLYLSLIDQYNGGAILIGDDKIYPYKLTDKQIEEVKQAYGQENIVEYNGDILKDAGKISHEIACDKALTEFEKYRVKQDKLYKSDFDLLLEDSKKEE